MKLSYTLERKDNVRIFIRHYYHAGRKWVRRLGGPLILLVATLIYLTYDWRSHTLVYGLAAFVMGFGIYYTFKPLFFILLRPKKFAAEKIQVEITPKDRLGITQGEEPTANLKFSQLSSVQMMKQDMILTFGSKASLYILRDRVTEGDFEAFFQALSARVTQEHGGK